LGFGSFYIKFANKSAHFFKYTQISLCFMAIRRHMYDFVYESTQITGNYTDGGEKNARFTGLIY